MRKPRVTAEAADVREVTKEDEQWRQELTPLQYSVLREAHTERPFTGEYVHNHEDGSYRCAGCGAELFSSDAKFDSGTGWPSFDEPAVAEAVELRPDNSLFMRRTEVVRAKMRTMESLRLNDTIEDVLITLAKQYHLIRLLKNSGNEHGLFLYLVLDRGKSNLALARHNLKRIEADLSV